MLLFFIASSNSAGSEQNGTIQKCNTFLMLGLQATELQFDVMGSIMNVDGLIQYNLIKYNH